jgi:hypothetical protein
VSLEIIWVVLFVISGGLLFNDRFRNNWLAVGFAAAIAVASTYYLTQQIAKDVVTRERASTLPQATSPSPSVSSSAVPPPPVRFYFPNIEAVRAAINNLDENTTQASLSEMFGPPVSQKELPPAATYNGEAAQVFVFRAGPYSLAVVRTKSFFVGYGISASREPDAGGKTPVIFLSRGGAAPEWDGAKGLESLELGKIRGNCDDWMNRPSPSDYIGTGKFIVISARQPMPAASPKCNFGRPGQYASYSFVYPVFDVNHDPGICQDEFERIEEAGIMNRLQCPDYISLKPIFLFMSKASIDVQQWTVMTYDTLFVM